MAAICYSAGCARILEAKEVTYFEVSQTRAQPHVVLSISGMGPGSALVVNEPSLKMEGEELQVRISLSRPRKDSSTNFEFPIDVPDQATTVVFGDARRVIWTRQGGVIR
jgi:hypothetical protein